VVKIPDGPYDNPNHTFLIGRAYYEIGQVDRAAELIEEAVRKDPRHAEAHYYLGLIRDERGDVPGATQAFLRSRELDIELGMPPWAPGREGFQGLGQKSIAALNPVLRRYVEAADIYVSDVPGMELVAEGVDPRALVLLDGIASEERERGFRSGDSRPCARVFIYALNVARLAGSMEGIEREVTLALEREITATFLEAEQAERSERELN
jgi:tetratricopeptide (TPR) repeat protein